MLKELEKQYPAKFGDKRDLVERVHSKTPEPGLASRLKKENPAGYDYVKGLAIEANLIGGTPRQAPPVQQPTEPTAVQVADAVKKFTKERCHGLFVGEKTQTGDTRHSESASKLSKEEYAQARIAAKFWGIPLSGDNTSAVRFAYSTSRDRAAKRAAAESVAKAEEQRIADQLLLGIHRDAKGNLALVDEQAFNTWKAEKAANSEAIDFLEKAAA
jgi:hypothetical protein